MKLTTPLAIIIGCAVLGIVLVGGAYLIDESVWTALAAVGTIGAVIMALYSHVFREWLERPVLEISLFEPGPPHLRQTPATDMQTGQRVGTMYPLSIRLQNTGKSVAKGAQPLITGMGYFEDGKWITQDNWIDTPLRWGLDETAVIAGAPTAERELVPNRPYFFNLGWLGTRLPDSFVLSVLSMPGGQRISYGPGEFCFELTVFADGADPAKKYFHIQWEGGCTEDFEEVKRKIKVNPKNGPPW